MTYNERASFALKKSSVDYSRLGKLNTWKDPIYRSLNGIEPSFGVAGEGQDLCGSEATQAAECMIDIVEPAGADTFAVMQLGGKHITALLHSETTAGPREQKRLSFDLGKVSYFAPETGLRLH